MHRPSVKRGRLIAPPIPPQDHLLRDMDAGRYSEGTTLLLVTHGLAARIFLQRWFHWTVEQARAGGRRAAGGVAVQHRHAACWCSSPRRRC